VALNAQADVGEDRLAAEGYGRVAETYQGHCIKNVEPARIGRL
jgi:hypothetical protein